MSENGEIYSAGKNFTLPPALTALTNSTSVLHLLFLGLFLLGTKSSLFPAPFISDQMFSFFVLKSSPFLLIFSGKTFSVFANCFPFFVSKSKNLKPGAGTYIILDLTTINMIFTAYRYFLQLLAYKENSFLPILPAAQN